MILAVGVTNNRKRKTTDIREFRKNITRTEKKRSENTGVLPRKRNYIHAESWTRDTGCRTCRTIYTVIGVRSQELVFVLMTSTVAFVQVNTTVGCIGTNSISIYKNFEEKNQYSM